MTAFLYSEFAATTSGDFTTEIIPISDLSLSSWYKYVYRIYSGSNADQDRCTAMCVFDHPNSDNASCHFTAFVSDVCYLGNFGEEKSLLIERPDSALHIKTG